MSTIQITSTELRPANTILVSIDKGFNVLHLKINNDNIPVFSNQIENGKIENFNHIQVKDFSHNEHGEKSHEQQVSSKQTVILSFSSSNPNSNTFDNILFNINTSFLLSSPQSPHLNSASASQFRTIDIGISDGIKFTLFNKLPTELRLKIWRYAASQLPQIIGVKDIENKEELCGTKARCPLLLTCTEARNEVLKRKVDFNSPYVPCSRTRFDVKDFIEAKAPKIHTNLEVDTLYLMIFRQSIYDRDLPKLWTKLLSGPKEKIRRLAISYTLYKRRWDHMNAMVLKLDLEVLVLVVDAEEISDGDVPTFVMPRSKVGRRSEFWRTWEGLKSSERRNLVNYKEHYERFWKNMVLLPNASNKLTVTSMRDPFKWKVPRILFRDIVNSKNASPEERVAAEEDEALEAEELLDSDDEYSEEE